MIKKILKKIFQKDKGAPGPDTRHLFLKYTPGYTPTDEEISNYYDSFLEHLKKYDTVLPSRFKSVFKTFGSLVKPGMKVLDLGCGTGITTAYLAGLGAEPVGIDMSPKIIEHAKSKNPKVNFICHDATSVRLDRQFDLICLIDMLEHIPSGKRPMLWETVDIHSRPGTLVTINLPDPAHILRERNHDLQAFQIVDEPVPIEEIIDAFENLNFKNEKTSYLSVTEKKDTVHFLFRKLDKHL